MSRYKTVTDSIWWSGSVYFEAFSAANWRISNIVGDKSYFSGKCKFYVAISAVYIYGMLW